MTSLQLSRDLNRYGIYGGTGILWACGGQVKYFPLYLVGRLKVEGTTKKAYKLYTRIVVIMLLLCVAMLLNVQQGLETASHCYQPYTSFDFDSYWLSIFDVIIDVCAILVSILIKVPKNRVARGRRKLGLQSGTSVSDQSITSTGGSSGGD